MKRKIEVGKIYKHFKGNLYEVIAIGYNSESLCLMVVYKDIKNGKIWIRDYDMFNSLVDKNKYPEVTQKYRFEEEVYDN